MNIYIAATTSHHNIINNSFFDKYNVCVTVFRFYWYAYFFDLDR
jgi:hypothetical protein